MRSRHHSLKLLCIVFIAAAICHHSHAVIDICLKVCKSEVLLSYSIKMDHLKHVHVLSANYTTRIVKYVRCWFGKRKVLRL